MKFLTDAQTRKEFGDMLRSLGWQVDTVYQHGLGEEKNDANLISWARSFGFVFVTFDLLTKEQGFQVNREIKRRGGKVIVIHGGPEQDPQRALGRMLFHWPDWFLLLEKQHGRLEIKDLRQGIKFIPRGRLSGRVLPVGEDAFDPYLEKVSRRTRKSPTRLRRINPQQSDLDLTFKDDTGA